MIRYRPLCGFAALMTVFSAPLAFAQAAPAAPAAAAEGLGGPLVPGVCFLSREAVFANAKVGLAATARLRQLTDEVKSEIDAARTPLTTEIKALDGQKASLTPAQFEAKSKPLQTRWDALQQKATQRSRELEATRAKALERISAEAQSVIAQAYRSKNCGLLLARETILGGNMGGDLTAAVVQALDAKISTITFARETLPPPATPAAPAAR